MLTNDRLIAAAVLFAALTGPATAQTTATTFSDLQKNLVAQTVYVTTAPPGATAGQTVKGRIVDMSESSLRLMVGTEVRDLPMGDVVSVATHHRNAGKGATIGLLIGSGLGLWGWASACGSGFSGDCGFGSVLLMLGAGYGAGIGAIVGVATVSDRLVYRAPAKPAARASAAPFVSATAKGVRATIRF